MSSHQPSKSKGQMHSTIGGFKETIGNTFHARGLASSGREEKAQGQAEINAAKAQGYAEGTVDRVTGKKDSVVGAVTGDRSQQATGNTRQSQGQTKQQWNS